MSKRFIFTLLTLVVIAVVAAGAVLLAKGYRLSPTTGTISGTGIISVTSLPDQASVYLDGHLTSATNATINSLSPKSYQVRIVKEGYIPWEKKVEVKEGLVTDIKATLFRTIPSVYPLTYTGAENTLLSPDSQKLMFIIPNQIDANSTKKSGIWVWQMSDKSLTFTRGAEPHQIMLSSGTDFSKAKFRWSPDSSQLMVTFPDRTLLLDADRLNDPPRDITPTLTATIKSWDDDQKTRDETRFNSIKDLAIRKIASDSATKRWSPDETKLLLSQDNKTFKVVDMIDKKSYDLPKGDSFEWLADSLHLAIVEKQDTKSTDTLVSTKISVVEFDGGNKSEIYAGNIDPKSVFVWPDGSRMVVLSAFLTATASQPNLYGINLK